MQNDVDILLDDLKSIKVSPRARGIISSASVEFSRSGTLPFLTVCEIRKIHRRYSRKIKELYASREAAKRSIWRAKNRVSKEDAEDMILKRIAAEKASEDDLGI